MDSPYLEILIEKTLEKSLSEYQLMTQISDAYRYLYNKIVEIRKENQRFFIHIPFESISEFNKLYENVFSMYSFIYDNFLFGNVEFKKLFNSDGFSEPVHMEEVSEFYLILKYRTNYVFPLRRYYRLTSPVNQLLGDNIVEEEIADGFLRFIKTRIDFDALLTPGDVENGWKERFKKRNIDLNHPLVKNFFQTVQDWKSQEK